MKITNQNTSIQFQGFAKFKGKRHEVTHLAKELKKTFPDNFIFSDKKIKKEKTYYIITGKHEEKFLSLIGKMHFADLKHNIEKYLGEKAVKISLKKVRKKIESGKLNI